MQSTDTSLQTYQDHLALVNAIIPALSTADQVTVVSQLYSNAVNSHRDEYNERYPRLCGRDWTYYLMKPQIAIGRETDTLEQYQQPQHRRPSGSHTTEIDLGPVKIVSRVHAIIRQDELNNKVWEIEVRGRNGAKVNGSKVKPKKSPLGRIRLELNSGDIIEIAGIQMVFILPDRPPVIPESCLFSLISKLMERRSGDNEFNVSTQSLQSILNRLGHSDISAELLPRATDPTSMVVTSQVDALPIEIPNSERTTSEFQLEPAFVPASKPVPEPELEPALPPMPYPQETTSALRTEETGNIPTSRPSLSIPSSSQYGKTLNVPVESSNIVSSIPLTTLPMNPPISGESSFDHFNAENHDNDSSINNNDNNNYNNNNYNYDSHNTNNVDRSTLKRRTVSRNPMLPPEKPPAPYSTLITQAILSKPYGVISVAEIYEFVYTKYDYFKRVKTGWRNSIRHNLSINPAFEKVPKSRTPFGGKGTVWRINKKYQDEFLRKWRDGTLALKNAKTISIDRQLQLYMSRHNKLPSLTDE